MSAGNFQTAPFAMSVVGAVESFGTEYKAHKFYGTCASSPYLLPGFFRRTIHSTLLKELFSSTFITMTLAFQLHNPFLSVPQPLLKMAVELAVIASYNLTKSSIKSEMFKNASDSQSQAQSKERALGRKP